MTDTRTGHQGVTPACIRCGGDPHKGATPAADQPEGKFDARKVIGELQTERNRLRLERDELAHDLSFERGSRGQRRAVRELLPKVRDELERRPVDDTVIDRVRVDELLTDIDHALRNWR